MKPRKIKYDIDIGDFVKFKVFRDPTHFPIAIKLEEEYIEGFKDKYKHQEYKHLDYKDFEFDIFHGTVVDISNSMTIDILVDSNDKRDILPKGLPIKIDKRNIIQYYPKNVGLHLTPRLALKHIWKNLTFREVKTVKCSELMYAEYRYVSDNGFERCKRFSSLEKAYEYISPEYHHNIIPHYKDFFGFTTEEALRFNDIYSDKEIFFSKKCYCELDWGENPSGDFAVKERGFNDVPPLSETLICGIVENGEKGLFFRKWFCCSKEFLTLWTMVCNPTDPSLYKKSPNINSYNWSSDEADKIAWKIKDLETLREELDTSWYSVDYTLPLSERKRKFISHNVERAALYYQNIYQKVAEVLFDENIQENSGTNDKKIRYNKFQKKLLRNLLWCKNIT